MEQKKIIFPSMKSKREFEEKFNDGSYIFQWATINDDGTVEAHYKTKKSSLKKSQRPSEKQLNLFV